MRWSEEATLAFVKLYLKYQCLWDCNNEGYKCKRSREKAYSDIVTEFKPKKIMTIPEVKLKIRSLRTTYVQTVHRTLKRSKEDSNYEPSLIWFHEMDRCLRHLNFTDTTQLTDVDSSCQLFWSTESEDNVHPDPLIANETNEATELNLGIKRERNCSPTYDVEIVKKKKCKPQSKSVVPEVRTEVESSISNTNQVAHKAEDEFDIYGKFIASQLRQMNLKKALQLQLEIQGLVSKSRISDL